MSDRLLRPPTYSVQSLFWVVTLLGIVMGVMAAIGFLWAIALLMTVLMIAGHVAGNALGKRLRDGKSPSQSGPASPAARHDLTTGRANWQPPASSRLSEHHPTGRKSLIFAGIGSVLAGLAGSGLSLWHYGSGITGPAVIVAALAAAVLGGLLTFFSVICLGTIADAWRDMWREHKKRL